MGCSERKRFRRSLSEVREKANSEAQKWQEEQDRLRREKEEPERKDFLCIGTWAENIPRNRRFVLCERKGKRTDYITGYFGYFTDLCAVDIVRGFSSPHFGYYGGDGEEPHQLKDWWKERLQPVIEADTEEKFLTRIRCDWNFFSLYGHGEFPFLILDYKVDEKGNVTITGRGETKMLAEHQADLRKEFEKGDES